ncbi:MAG: hypothetical protein ABIT38_11335, partial [Gemmatimonadaceae bacterium]
MIALALVPLAVLIVALFFGYVLPQRRRNVRRQAPIALAPFGHGERSSIPPRPARATDPYASKTSANAAAAGAAASEDVKVRSAVPTASAAAPPLPVEQPVQARAAEADQLSTEDLGRVLRLQVAGERRDVVTHDHRPIGAATLRLERPFDGTLQFLPGRLEVTEGREVGQELKFVR